MRIARLFSVALAVLTAGLLLAPPGAAAPPLRLASYVVDEANALSGADMAEVTQAIDKLYADRKVRLWVVFVDSFSGSPAADWARATMRTSDFGDHDALLAVATTDRAYALATQMSSGSVWINKHADLAPNIPFGGAGLSGLGTELGEEGLLEFTQLQIINMAK